VRKNKPHGNIKAKIGGEKTKESEQRGEEKRPELTKGRNTTMVRKYEGGPDLGEQRKKGSLGNPFLDGRRKEKVFSH